MDLKVLICDDSILMRKKIKDVLFSMGIKQLSEADNGQHAIDIYKEKKPDLVFMDITMPVKSGIEALSEIMTYDSKAKVIIASSIGTNNKLKDAIKLEAYDFMQKPINEEQLRKIIINYIDKVNNN